MINEFTEVDETEAHIRTEIERILHAVLDGQRIHAREFP
jgi:hypothetical protein